MDALSEGESDRADPASQCSPEKEGRNVQVLELVVFKKRLAASHARAQVYTEMAIHALSSLPAPTPASMLEGASALAQTLRSALPPGRFCLP